MHISMYICYCNCRDSKVVYVGNCYYILRSVRYTVTVQCNTVLYVFIFVYCV